MTLAESRPKINVLSNFDGGRENFKGEINMEIYIIFVSSKECYKENVFTRVVWYIERYIIMW